MVYIELVWKFYSKFMLENMNRNVFENLCRKWLNNIFWLLKKINDFMKWNCVFFFKYFCIEYFVFLIMFFKIIFKYILGIFYGLKVDKNGLVML